MDGKFKNGKCPCGQILCSDSTFHMERFKNGKKKSTSIKDRRARNKELRLKQQEVQQEAAHAGRTAKTTDSKLAAMMAEADMMIKSMVDNGEEPQDVMKAVKAMKSMKEIGAERWQEEAGHWGRTAKATKSKKAAMKGNEGDEGNEEGDDSCDGDEGVTMLL